MTTNGLLVSIPPEEIGIYLALCLCGLSIISLAYYVRRKFQLTSVALGTLNKEWQDAEASFFNIADVARQQISSLKSAPLSPAVELPANQSAVAIDFDLRSRVVAMAKRGGEVSVIARSAGLTEAEVDVLLGMSRIERGKIG